MMENRQKLMRLMLISLMGISFSSCVDNEYDLSKDLDLTMGLGSDKLAMKIGDTEKIYLRDVLETEDTEVDTTSTSLYYLVKDGNTNVDVEVDRIPPFWIDEVDLAPTMPILSATDNDVNLVKGKLTPTFASASNAMHIDIEDIPAEVVRLRHIYNEAKMVDITLEIEQTTPNPVRISAIEGLRIIFPEMLFSSRFPAGTHTLDVPNKTNINASSIHIASIPIDYLEFGNEADFGQLITDNKLIINEDVIMEGTFTLEATQNFTLTKGNEVNVKLVVEVGNFEVDRITGIVDPVINPSVDPIEISNDLPSFLQDEDVVLAVSNPTIKFNMLGEDKLPIPLNFYGVLNSILKNQNIASVRIPADGQAEMPELENSSFYFYQGARPFDPNGVNSAATPYLVPTLSNIIKKIPDVINIDLDNGKIKSNQKELHSIALGIDFNVELDYNVYVPFSFNSGLKIVYKDSIMDMNSDLKDYQADGLTLTATAVNSIPLNLNLTLTPIDVNGKVMTDITVEPVVIQAAPQASSSSTTTETNIELVMSTTNPASISKLDRFNIEVNANSINSNQLCSNQYFLLKDLRIKLNGQVIANFN